MIHSRSLACSIILGALFALCLPSSPRSFAASSITVHMDRPGPPISPMLYGIFFEEINHAGDGGLYAEMVRNRSFEESENPDSWTLVTTGDAEGTMALESRAADGFNRRVMRLCLCEPKAGTVGVRNDGYWGMALAQGETYDLALEARCADGFQGPLTVRLEAPDGTTLAEGRTGDLTPDWKRHTVALTATATHPSARLVLSSARKGTVWLDVVSLFPRNTYKQRANGLRADLAGMLAELSPSFLRFPGGCWVEGNTMAESLRWKQTIGPIAERRTQYNLWQYQSTNGLGYHEYLQMAEDLGAEPLFVINCGMSHREVVPMDRMGEYVQDALDAIEYANGPVASPWGAKRAQAGHPAPFGLKYIQIGNENGGPAYEERYALFHDAIRAKYPDVKIVANVWGGYPTNRGLDIIDEHYYNSPEFFIHNAHRYDTYDRKGPKVYVGEYAVTQGSGAGNLAAALGEAAFMTGLERNADVVVMASYAPLFANVHYKRWNPDLINFDSSRAYGTPSYHVQRMFSRNRGDAVLPSDVVSPDPGGADPASGAIGLGTWNTQAEFRDVRVTRGGETLFSWDDANGMEPWRVMDGNWSVQDGALRQTGSGQDFRATAGDPTWTDYTLSLRARKLSGDEGFLVMVRVRDDRNWVWWNLGGWGNSRHAIERSLNGGKFELPVSVPGRIETGRWYDIRVDVAGARIRCYLDGTLVHDATLPGMESLYAVASEAASQGEVILKVVNVSDADQDTTIRLDGAAAVQPRGSAWVLASASRDDENTIDNPKRVAPSERAITGAAAEFRHTFPARSVTVLRVKATR